MTTLNKEDFNSLKATVRGPLFLPKGAEIRDPVTNDLIATASRDIHKYTPARIEYFVWAGEAPEPGDVASATAFYNAHARYMAEANG